MRSFKKNLRYITHLIFFLWANTAVFSTSEHLMLPDTGEVPQKLVKYYEEKWKQKYRLQKTTPFNRGFLRFVSSSNQLLVGYGVLPDSGIEIPNLDLPDSRYEDLRKIGMFVKVFLGYLTNSDSDGLRSFTPERINVLVPCVSSIIQWKSGMAPKLVPTGFLRREQNGPIVVLLSGVQGKEYQEKISKFYNCIYKETEDTPIEVLSADDVADMYIPYLLNGMVEAKGIEPFTMKYLGAEVIEKKLKKTFCYVQEVKTDHQRTQNVISCTLEFLKLLIQNQDCISRHDTVSRLCNDYLEGIDALPSKDKEADFRKFVQKYKQELMKAAFDRMKDEKNKLEQMHLQVLEAATFSQISNELQTLSQQLIEYNKWRQYLMYCLYPSSYLNTLEKAQSLWGLIHELKDELQCSNPNGGRSIDAVKRLYKACYPSNDNLNHTERLLMGFFKAKPQSLLGDLKEQFEKKKSSNTPLVVEAGFPKYLGIIADSFSWLDVCKSCADFLHTNPIWESALQDVRPFIEAEGFTVPFPKINGMFRFVSQDHYPVADNSYHNGSVPPLDLADAGGGADYRDSGWDFRLLSEERISLVTRYSPRETLIRDQVIEGIQNRLIDAVSAHTSLEFFTARWLLPILDMHRPFCINALRLLQAYHPENTPLKLKLAQKMKYNDPRVYHLLKSIITIPNETMKQQAYADVFFDEKIKENPQEYTRVFFGRGCIAKINAALESQPIQDISSFVIDFAKYSCVFDSKNKVQLITEETMTFENATVSIVTYWKNKWKKGARVYDTSNYESDAKSITELMIEKLQHLSTLEQEEDLPFEKTALCEALGQLKIK